jgi:hypothetical protein
MKTYQATLGALTAAACLLAPAAAPAAPTGRTLIGASAVNNPSWTVETTYLVRQGQSPYYNLFTGRPIGGGGAQYNPLTGNYQWPCEVYNLYTGRPLPASPNYNPYTGMWGYQPGNAWAGYQPYRYGYNR